MFPKNDTDTTKLNEIIDTLLDNLSELEFDSAEYAKAVDQLTKLYKLKEIDIKLNLQESELIHKQNIDTITNQQKDEEHVLKMQMQREDCNLKELEIENKKREMKIPFGIKPETLILVATNLAGIALILGHERLNVVTSKAIGFVSKLKN